jgi:hypothetical protein
MPFGEISNFMQAAGGFWLVTSGALLILAAVVGIVGWALLEEAALVRRRKSSRRHAFSDHRQSFAVCQCTRRLTSVRRSSRLEAVMILRQLNDPTAVPALLKALDRYNRDVPFAITVIETLGEFGDPRAVPVLHALTAGRHYGLMRAARQTTEAIEAKSALLRSSSEPLSAAARSSRTLLRAAQPQLHPDTAALLRAGERPGT